MSVSGRVFRFLFIAAALFGVAISPRTAAADEPERPVYYDSSVYPPPSTRYKLALVGVAVSATWYGAAYGFSAAWPDAPGAEDLRIPIAGPWMALGETGCADDDPDCSTIIVVLRAVLTTIDGVGQAGGLAVALESLFLPTAAQNAAPRRRHRPKPVEGTDSFQIRPAPVLTGRTLGLGLSGTF
jgi:hypothetical protein